jgi:hypothetical protein
MPELFDDTLLETPPTPPPEQHHCYYCDTFTTTTNVRIMPDSHRTVPVCSSCLPRYTFTCARCNGQYTQNAQMNAPTTDGRRQHLCTECFAERYRSCYYCGTAMAYDDAITIPNSYSDAYACESCYDSRFTTCSSCGQTIPTSQGSRCRKCQVIKEYGYKPSPLFYGSSPYFGVELEVNVACDDDDHLDSVAAEVQRLLGGPDHTYLKTDSSITDGDEFSAGFEIVTHPHDLEEHRKLWPAFFSAVRNNSLDARVTSYKSGLCGMHVHISRHAFSSDRHIMRFVVAMNEPDNERFVQAIAQRTSSRWCEIKKKYPDYWQSEGRYEAVNTLCRDTIEVRIFRGSVREDRFFKNLEFCAAFLEWTRKERPVERLNYRYFVRWVISKRAQYPHLHAYLVEKGYAKHSINTLKTSVQELADVCA